MSSPIIPWCISGGIHLLLLAGLAYTAARSHVVQVAARPGRSTIALQAVLVQSAESSPQPVRVEQAVSDVAENPQRTDVRLTEPSPLEPSPVEPQRDVPAELRSTADPQRALAMPNPMPLPLQDDMARGMQRTESESEPATRPRTTTHPPRRQKPIEPPSGPPVMVPPQRAEQGARFDHLPRKLATNPAPPYPADAYAQGLEGRVQLLVQIDARGRVQALEIAKSSGVASLDAAAVKAVRKWRFVPAERAGQPVAASVKVPVRFSIRK